jgi:hypothetical protein
MTKERLFKLLIAKNFFTDYCKGIADWRHKLYGSFTNKAGETKDFTDADKVKINRALDRLKFKID